MRTERPPEQWLFKAWDGDVMIDLIFVPQGVRITDQVIERGEDLNVAGMDVRVMALDDILTTKLFALDEHSADFSQLLQIARSLREQIDWPGLRQRTSSHPFAKAFFVLVEELGIASPGEAAPRARSVRIG